MNNLSGDTFFKYTEPILLSSLEHSPERKELTAEKALDYLNGVRANLSEIYESLNNFYKVYPTNELHSVNTDNYLTMAELNRIIDKVEKYGL